MTGSSKTQREHNAMVIHPHARTTPMPSQTLTISVESGASSAPLDLSDGAYVSLPFPDNHIEITAQGAHGTATLIDENRVIYSADIVTSTITDTFSFRMKDATNDAFRP